MQKSVKDKRMLIQMIPKILKLPKGWLGNYFSTRNNSHFKPVRKGTAHIIKEHKPIVVPIIIDGFRRDKKDLRIKKRDPAILYYQRAVRY
jgi:hypothetical protein